MLRRVLLTTDSVGGVWRYTMEIAQGFTALGAEVVLAVLGPAPNAEQRGEAGAIGGLRWVATCLPLDWLAETPDDLAFASHVLASVAKQSEVDTVQLHAPALVGDARWPAPVIAVAHSCVGTWWQAVRGGVMPADLAWRAEATRTGLLRADAVVAPSGSFAAALRACYGITRPVEVVLNGRTPMQGNARRQRQALCAGRLWDEGKAIGELDAACAGLAWPVLAAGPVSGPNGAGVTCRYLRMLGCLDEGALANEFAHASVFVSVARYEPFGLAVLEAAQAGCALVLSDIPTFRELWDGAAFFVGKDGIAPALDRLLRDPALCGAYGTRAAARAAGFSSRRMVVAMGDIHCRLGVRAGALA